MQQLNAIFPLEINFGLSHALSLSVSLVRIFGLSRAHFRSLSCAFSVSLVRIVGLSRAHCRFLSCAFSVSPSRIFGLSLALSVSLAHCRSLLRALGLSLHSLLFCPVRRLIDSDSTVACLALHSLEHMQLHLLFCTNKLLHWTSQ